MLRDSFQEDETLAKKFNTTAYYFVIIACTRHLEVFFFFILNSLLNTQARLLP